MIEKQKLYFDDVTEVNKKMSVFLLCCFNVYYTYMYEDFIAIYSTD